MNEDNKKTFVFITDQDIFHVFKIDDNEATTGLIAGMASNPIVVDVTGKEYVFEESGWKFIDGDFVKIVNTQDISNPLDEDDYEVE